MAKFAVFVLIALFAVQGFEAKSFEFQEDRNLDDVIDTIKEILQKIEDFIKNLGTNIDNVIQNLKDKIEQFIKNFNMNDLLNAIEKKIEEILSAAGIDVKAAKQCIVDEQPAMQKLMQDIGAEAMSCEETAMNQTQVLSDKMQEVFEEAMSVKDDVVARVTKCVDDNKDNKVKIASCLFQQITEIYSEVDKLKTDIESTIQLAQQVSQQVQDSMNACMQKVQTDLMTGELGIVNDIKNCIMKQ